LTLKEKEIKYLTQNPTENHNEYKITPDYQKQTLEAETRKRHAYKHNDKRKRETPSQRFISYSENDHKKDMIFGKKHTNEEPN